jgi:hypothetical protein
MKKPYNQRKIKEKIKDERLLLEENRSEFLHG